MVRRSMVVGDNVVMQSKYGVFFTQVVLFVIEIIFRWLRLRNPNSSFNLLFIATLKPNRLRADLEFRRYLIAFPLHSFLIT